MGNINTSSGARKNNSQRNMPRRGKVIANQAQYNFLQDQPGTMHPDQAGKDKAFDLLKDRPTKGPNKPRPEPLIFPLLETLAFHSNPKCIKATAKLLNAASLKVKNISRHPGWLLQKTYNLKAKPLVII